MIFGSDVHDEGLSKNFVQKKTCVYFLVPTRGGHIEVGFTVISRVESPFSHALAKANPHRKAGKLSAPKSQRFLRFAIAMPIADPRNRNDFRDKRKQ